MAKVDNTPVVYIRMSIQDARPDVSDYKAFASTFIPTGTIVVEVPVPKSEVIEKNDDHTVLTLAGWKAALKAMAQITEELKHEARAGIPTYNPNKY